MKAGVLTTLGLGGLCAVGIAAAQSPQADLEPTVNAPAETLEFDWPMIRVGTASYEAGPTGATVIRFGRKVYSAIDVRGTPGTVNAPYMNLLYDLPELDTLVFAGGSWYGLEAVTGVSTALKDDGVRDGSAFGTPPNIAMSVGSIIYDFGSRRLNEIYPDKRLAQAAYRATKPGQFPMGATGAGRFAKTGAAFGCDAYSGQGAAYREVGEVKIAAFVIVNSYGVVTDREGQVAACYTSADWPESLQKNPRTAALLKRFVERADRQAEEGEKKTNTTLSLVVTNQKLSPVELKRLAVQVHGSIGRAIQPFTTMYDGDVMYAVSTAELKEPQMTVPDLGTVAGEVMWDAILNSVPEQPQPVTPADGPVLDAEERQDLAGDYRFSKFVTVRINATGDGLVARAVGERQAYAIGKDAPTALKPVSDTDFMVPGRYPLTLRFADDQLVINPGHWQQVGQRIVE